MILFMSEPLRGTGKVFKGEEFVAEVGYEIRGHKERPDSTTLGGHSSVPGMMRLELMLFQTPVFPVRDIYTLHLADGRKLKFWRSGGGYSVAGALYREG
jgi:hypothetical protein